MISILTGDIINSQGLNPDEWLKSLKKVLNKYAKETIAWEIFRGDSFQVETTPELALELAVKIKLSIKQFEDMDVRIAIGFGDKSYSAQKITESNGTAFVNSGECFEKLKKNTLAIKTPNSKFDYTINTMFQLALLTMDNWTINSVKFIQGALDNPKMNQKDFAKLLGKSQSTVSEGLKRSGFYELQLLLEYFKNKVKDTKW